MPRRLRNILIAVVAVLIPLSLLPPLLVGMARVTRSTEPRVHLIPDMDSQPKFKAQARNPLFADGRAMRPVILGTVARDRLQEDHALYCGKTDGQWVKTFPIAVTSELMRRGQERFGIFCATCHGLVGSGDGPTAMRADQLQEGTWTVRRLRRRIVGRSSRMFGRCSAVKTLVSKTCRTRTGRR